MYREKIREYLTLHKEEMIEDIKALVRIDSVRSEAKEGMPFGEGAAAALAEGMRIMESHGFHAKNTENYAIETTLNEKELQLDILAHLDVVPVGDGWSVTAPFEPVVVDGKLYGRGTADDKGPAMAALYAMAAIKELNIPVSKNVRLILGSDEECGSSDIKYYFSKNEHAPMSISPDADFPLIFLEKGNFSAVFFAQTAPQTGLPRLLSAKGGIVINAVPAKAEAVVEGLTKDMLREYCEVTEKKTGTTISVKEQDGKSTILVEGLNAHASTPQEGVNAITALLELLASIPFAQGERTEYIKKAAKLFPHGAYYGEGLGVDLEDEISGKTTLSLDLFSLDEEKMEGAFDSRVCNLANDENTKYVIYRKFEEAGFSHNEKKMNPPHYVPKDSVLVKTLLESYTKITGKTEEPIAIGGGTYVHTIENGVACGCADPAVDNHMHGPDEFVVIEQLLMSAEIFADAIISLCQ